LLAECDSAFDFRSGDERVCYKNISDASGRHYFRFRNLGDGDADGAGSKLQLRDGRKLVRFGVRTQADAVVRRCFGHAADIRMHFIRIDDDARRF
jgi:hypothetical protein